MTHSKFKSRRGNRQFYIQRKYVIDNSRFKRKGVLDISKFKMEKVNR